MEQNCSQTKGSSVGKESACSAGDPDFNPWVCKIPWEGNGNPLQYSCLENSMDRGDWQATVHGAARVRHGLATKPQPPQFACIVLLAGVYAAFLLSKSCACYPYAHM